MENISYRSNGILALSKVLNKKNNINIIEKMVYKTVSVLHEINIEKQYKQHLFQVICDIINGVTLKTIIDNINNKRIGWKHIMYDDIEFLLQEQDGFILKPFEVAEGILNCTKCGSNRTFSHSKQVRSCDEGTSVFATCVVCKNSWVTSA